MKFNLTKIAVGVAAVVAASALLATAAYSEPVVSGEQGAYTLLTDSDGHLCIMGVAGEKNRALLIAISEEGGQTLTGISYVDPELGDLTGKSGTVTLVLDSDKYDWDATGGKNSLTVASDDASVPERLKAADTIGLEVDDQLIVAVKSDADFETALDKTIACAQGLAK